MILGNTITLTRMTHQLSQSPYFNAFQNYVCSQCEEQNYQFDLNVRIEDGEVVVEFDPFDNGYYCTTCEKNTEMIEKPEPVTAQEEADPEEQEKIPGTLEYYNRLKVEDLNKDCGDSTRFNVCYETGYIIDCENDPFFIITRGDASKHLCQEAWEDAKVKRTLQQEGWACDDWE